MKNGKTISVEFSKAILEFSEAFIEDIQSYPENIPVILAGLSVGLYSAKAFIEIHERCGEVTKMDHVRELTKLLKKAKMPSRSLKLDDEAIEESFEV